MENEKKISDTQTTNASSIKVETYASDMARTIDGSEGSYIKKIIEEQEKNENENDSPERKQNKILIFISIFLIICAIGALLFLMFFKKDISSISVKPQFVPMIYLDDTVFTEVAGQSKDKVIENILNQIKNTEVKPGGILGIYVTTDKQIVGLRKFLTLISANLNQTKMTFVDDNFLIGATSESNKDLFIIIKMRSVYDVFDNMRSWEDKMFNDLHEFFNVAVNVDTKYLLTKNFEDGIVQNKNARILRDTDGKIIMMYVYNDDNSLIIANNENTIKEVMLRLSSSMIRK